MVKRHGESGHALIFALLVMILTLSASALIVTTLNLRMTFVQQQTTDLQVTALCDAALAMALAELETEPSYTGTDGFVPFADGKIQIRVEPVAFRRINVEVESAYSNRSRAALAEVRLEPTRLISWRPIAPSGEEETPWWR